MKLTVSKSVAEIYEDYFNVFSLKAHVRLLPEFERYKSFIPI